MDDKYTKKANNRVEVEHLSYSVSSRNILNGLSLQVEENKIVGLIGPNGSGKTTLLKHIYRALPTEKNTVFINGMEIGNMSYKDTARQVTVMKQENLSDFDYTIFEMVLMGRAPYRNYMEKDTSEDKKIALTALENVGMAELSNQNFTSLSGGEKQRVLIARSLAQGADIFILDEPTNHLDVHYQWALMDMIKKLNKTVLSVFHELNLACSYCDYLLVLDKGEIVAQGKPIDICTSKLLAEVFRVKADVIIKDDGKP